MVSRLALSLLLFFLPTQPIIAQQTDDLRVLPLKTENGPTSQMMRRYLLGLSARAAEKRRMVFENLKTKEDFKSYRDRLQKIFLQQLGGFPKRSPLNAKIVGKLNGFDFRVENIIFESRPKHYVTANLYLPKSEPPFPAVLVPCGHSFAGKANSSYQRVCILLARNGIAALCYDPIGQGERYQLLNSNGRPTYNSTTEHSLVGVGSILVGRNTATYRIWDGMRAIDYLASRKEIDSKRIGCTGNSGGGTLTAYLMALDDRIFAAAPGCAVINLNHKVRTIGPGDAEQNIFGQMALGLEHVDYFHLHAPRPALICAATKDFVPIEGTWRVYREANRFYTKLGHSERISIVEADHKHGFSQPLREAAVRWMRRWLIKVEDAITEPAQEVFSRPQLQCTPDGQVQQMPGAISVMDLNSQVFAKFADKRKQLWQEKGKALAEVRRITGIRPLSKLPQAKISVTATSKRNGYQIKKMVLSPEPGIHLPALLFVPLKANGDLHLYLHDLGKQVDANPKGPIEKLFRKGQTVLAVDVRGIVETDPSGNNLWGGSWDDILTAYLLGKSYLAMRAEDILIASRFLSQQGKKKSTKIRLTAIGKLGPPALHAVALEPQLFYSVNIIKARPSWEEVLRDPTIRGHLVNAVHGALLAYDLPDLVHSLPKEVINIKDISSNK